MKSAQSGLRLVLDVAHLEALRAIDEHGVEKLACIYLIRTHDRTSMI